MLKLKMLVFGFVFEQISNLISAYRYSGLEQDL